MALITRHGIVGREPEPKPDRKHYTMVFTTAGSERLGADIMRMRYDKMVLVLQGIMAEAERQQLGDDKRGRPKLAASLRRLRDAMRVAVEEAQQVSNLCAPFNSKEK
jgi:hypothetical protein